MHLQDALHARSSASDQSLPQPAIAQTALAGRAAELQDRLETLVDGSLVESLGEGGSGAGQRFLDSLGVFAGGAHVGGFLDQAQAAAGSHSKNPLDQQGTGFRGNPNALVSEDPAPSEGEGGLWEDVKNFFSSLFGTAVGNPAAKGTVGNGAGAAAGTAFSILTANTDSPESKRNEAEGIIGLHRQGKTGTTNSNASEMLKAIEDDLEPLPDGEDNGGPHFITQADLDAIAARLGSKGLPTGEEAGAGGPIDEQATPEGQLGMLGQWAPDMGPAAAVFTAFDEKAMEARINAKKLGL